MDELEKSLLEHLRDTTVGGLDSKRFEARTELQQYVGTSEIYIARRSALPCGDKQKFALLIQRIATLSKEDLRGDPCFSEAIIQFTVLGSDKNNRSPVAFTVVRLADLLRKIFNCYKGSIGTNGFIFNSVMVRNNTRAARPPVDAGDGWSFAQTMDMSFTYQQDPVDYPA